MLRRLLKLPVASFAGFRWILQTNHDTSESPRTFLGLVLLCWSHDVHFKFCILFNFIALLLRSLGTMTSRIFFKQKYREFKNGFKLLNFSLLHTWLIASGTFHLFFTTFQTILDVFKIRFQVISPSWHADPTTTHRRGVVEVRTATRRGRGRGVLKKINRPSTRRGQRVGTNHPSTRAWVCCF